MSHGIKVTMHRLLPKPKTAHRPTADYRLQLSDEIETMFSNPACEEYHVGVTEVVGLPKYLG
jgi:hypothetical protein